MLPGGILLLVALSAAQAGDGAYDVARAASAGKSLTAAIAASLAERPDAVVISTEDVRAMLSLEAERAALGCDEDASCLAELSDALGTRLVVTAQLNRIDKTYQLSLSAFDSHTATVVARQTVSDTVFDDVIQKVPWVVGELWKDSGGKIPEKQVRVFVRDVKVAPAVFPVREDLGFSPWTVGAIQVGVGVCLAAPLAAPPGIGLLTAPLAIAGLTLAAVWLGDIFGAERGPLMWPLLIAYAAWIPLALIPALLSYAWFVGGALSQPVPFASFSVLGAFAGAGFVLGGTLLAMTTVPLTYGLLAEPKGPADSGGFPGLFAPGHQTTSRREQSPTRSSPSLAIRY